MGGIKLGRCLIFHPGKFSNLDFHLYIDLTWNEATDYKVLETPLTYQTTLVATPTHVYIPYHMKQASGTACCIYNCMPAPGELLQNFLLFL